MGTKKGKRHPTLGDDVMVGTDAKILGASEAGDDCTIATSAVLLKPLEDSVIAMGIPARPAKKDGVTTPKNKRSPTLEEYKDMKYHLEQMGKEMALLKDVLVKKNSVGGKG